MGSGDSWRGTSCPCQSAHENIEESYKRLTAFLKYLEEAPLLEHSMRVAIANELFKETKEWNIVNGEEM